MLSIFTIDSRQTEDRRLFLQIRKNSNVAFEALYGMQDFDRTVGEAIRFADQDGETLVTVTADHETRALSFLDAEVMPDFGPDLFWFLIHRRFTNYVFSINKQQNN